MSVFQLVVLGTALLTPSRMGLSGWTPLQTLSLG